MDDARVAKVKAVLQAKLSEELEIFEDEDYIRLARNGFFVNKAFEVATRESLKEVLPGRLALVGVLLKAFAPDLPQRPSGSGSGANPEMVFEDWALKRKDFFEEDYELPLMDSFGGTINSKVKLPCIDGRPSLLLHGLVPGITKSAELRSRFAQRDPAKNLFPVLGVSGCGKTRLAYELLASSFGFYFVADVSKNGGSADISSIQPGVQYADGLLANTEKAERAMLAAMLSRLLIFNRFRNTPGFTPRRWLMTQTYFKQRVQGDPFRELMSALFVTSREALLASILRLWIDDAIWVLDEAQVLGTGKKLFQSNKSEAARHVFSPILASLLNPLDFSIVPKHVVVVMGTGLSFLRLEESIVSKLAWYTEDMTRDQLFLCDLHTCWDKDSVKEYVSTIAQVDPEAVEEMCTWLVGRRRPVATVVERMLVSQGAHREVVADFVRVSTRENVEGSFYGIIDKLFNGERQGIFFLRRGGPVNFAEILTTVATFVVTVGEGRIVCAEAKDMLIIEYGLGMISRMEQNKLTFTIDEPLVLHAMLHYALDQGLVPPRLKNNMVLTKDVPSVGGRVWEKLARFDLHRFLTTAGTKLEDWDCFRVADIPEAWRGQSVKIRGDSATIATESEVSIEDFVHSQSRMFYSFVDGAGPDIMFFLVILGKLVPVFCQLKLRKRLSAQEADKAVKTTEPSKMYRANKSKRDVLREVSKEGYISLVIGFPAEVDPPKQESKRKQAARQKRLIGYVLEDQVRNMMADSYELLCALKGVDMRPLKRRKLC